MATKQEQLEQLRKDHEKLRIKRHGLYGMWSKTDCFKDLMEFIENIEKSYTNSAKKGVGMVNGENTSLTHEQRMSLLDKADGAGIIRTYIENNLSK